MRALNADPSGLHAFHSFTAMLRHNYTDIGQRRTHTLRLKVRYVFLNLLVRCEYNMFSKQIKLICNIWKSATGVLAHAGIQLGMPYAFLFRILQVTYRQRRLAPWEAPITTAITIQVAHYQTGSIIIANEIRNKIIVHVDYRISLSSNYEDEVSKFQQNEDFSVKNFTNDFWHHHCFYTRI